MEASKDNLLAYTDNPMSSPPPYSSEMTGRAMGAPPVTSQYGSAPPLYYNYPYPPPSNAGGMYMPPPQQEPPNPQVIVVEAGINACQHDVRSHFTCCGICWAIFCFPVGLICCCCCQRRECAKCGVAFH